MSLQRFVQCRTRNATGAVLHLSPSCRDILSIQKCGVCNVHVKILYSALSQSFSVICNRWNCMNAWMHFQWHIGLITKAQILHFCVTLFLWHIKKLLTFQSYQEFMSKPNKTRVGWLFLFIVSTELTGRGEPFTCLTLEQYSLAPTFHLSVKPDCLHPCCSCRISFLTSVKK